MANKSWMGWTFGEAATKTVCKVLTKVVGQTSKAFHQVVLVNLIVGLVQVVCSLIVLKKKRLSIFGTRSQVLGACAFGVSACIYGFLAFTVFLCGGEITLNTFIITLTIVPCAVLDRVIFRDKKLGIRKCCALAIFFLAGYFILGLPSFAEVVKFPLWIWLSLISMLLLAINEVISRSIKDIEPMVKNFWGGLATFVGSLLVLIFLGKADTLFDFHSELVKKLWILGVIGGLFIVVMWICKVRGYSSGATMAAKRLLMDSSYLTMVAVIGVWQFGESMTRWKVVGVLTYFGAFILMDEGTWKYVSGRFRRDRSMPVSDMPARVPTKI